MKRITCMAMLAIVIAVPLAGSTATAQEVEIPVIFDRSYLEEGGLHNNPLYYLDFVKSEIALSPDGRLIAFSSPMVYDIWIVTVEGGEPVRVYTVPDDQLLIIEEFQHIVGGYGGLNNISFSPDGTEITFCRRYYDTEKGSSWEVNLKPAKTEESIHFTGPSIPTIESVNIATGDVRTLVEEGQAPSWSADGRYLSYIHYDHRSTTDPENAEHHCDIAVLDTVTGETRFFEETGLDVVMAADNSALFYSEVQNLNRISLDNGEKTVFPIDGSGTSLKRIPNNDCILFEEQIELEGSLRVNSILDPDTGETVWAYTGLGAQTYSGCVTPDGNSIIYLKEYLFNYIRENGGSVNINTANMICKQPFDAEMRFAIGNTVEPPIVPGDYGILAEYGTLISDIDMQYVNHGIAWSPDGEAIVYSTDGYVIKKEDEPGFNSIGAQIWAASSSGGQPLLTYTIPAVEYMGASIDPPFLKVCGYSPDGTEILFSQATLDESRNSVPEVTVTETGHSERWRNPLSWLYAVNVETGDVRTVVEGSHFGLYSPDGRYLAYLINKRIETGDPFLEEHNNQAVIRNLETGEEVFFDVFRGCDVFFWTNDSSAIIAYTSNPGSSYPLEYSLLPVDGTEPAKYRGYSTGSWISSISPQNNQLAAIWKDRAIYLMNVETGENERFSPNVPGSFGNPVFSPDGTKIACIVSYTGSDVNHPYGTHSTSKVFVLDLEVPSDVSPTLVADAAPAAELAIANYPNPFNPSTTIAFSLPENGIARLDIYNLSGQKVRELVNGHVTAGVHEVVWDGRSDLGMPLASGVYIARIVRGNTVATQRMLLMK